MVLRIIRKCVPAWVEEPISPVRQSCSGGAQWWYHEQSTLSHNMYFKLPLIKIQKNIFFFTTFYGKEAHVKSWEKALNYHFKLTGKKKSYISLNFELHLSFESTYKNFSVQWFIVVVGVLRLL